MTARGKDRATPSSLRALSQEVPPSSTTWLPNTVRDPLRALPAFLPLSNPSLIHALPLCTDADLPCAAMLAALLLCALGAPVEFQPTDSPAGDFSGEEQEVTPDLLSASPIWGLIIGVTARHQQEVSSSFSGILPTCVKKAALLTSVVFLLSSSPSLVWGWIPTGSEISFSGPLQNLLTAGKLPQRQLQQGNTCLPLLVHWVKPSGDDRGLFDHWLWSSLLSAGGLSPQVGWRPAHLHGSF